MTSLEIEALALAEWRQFASSKTVTAVKALILTSTAAYVQGVITGQGTLTLKEYVASLFLAVLALTLRHAYAGVEAKADMILASGVGTIKVETGNTAGKP